LLIIFVLIQNIPPLLNWLIFNADFIGTSKAECSREGACWIFIYVWIERLMYGLYPNSEIWRINVSFILLISLVIISFYIPDKFKKYIIIFLLFIFPFIMINLISGGNFGLVWVETAAWGGLSLTFIISIFALLFCFPVGMFLALGRRSSAPIIRYSSIGFIEFWRGVPLITVLFMASVMFPMFLPDGTYMDKLVRVIIAITLFEAAYMAEVIRGGLQALPRGQYDAAKSLGMGYWRMHLLVILPQALKLVIPGIANTFLALVKDTPLILVVGLLELVGMIDMAKTNPDWLGFASEGYVFAGVVFWIICFNMSRYSQRLELRYKTDR
jgi:general L-amino acid transport system permease protein